MSVTNLFANDHYAEGARQARALLNWLQQDYVGVQELDRELARVSNFSDPFTYDRMLSLELQREIRSRLAKRRRVYSILREFARSEMEKGNVIDIGTGPMQDLREGAMAALMQRLVPGK